MRNVGTGYAKKPSSENSRNFLKTADIPTWSHFNSESLLRLTLFCRITATFRSGILMHKKCDFLSLS